MKCAAANFITQWHRRHKYKRTIETRKFQIIIFYISQLIFRNFCRVTPRQKLSAYPTQKFHSLQF